MNMEFGVFTFIIPDTIFNSMKKYMDYELEPDEKSQILFTYDNEPDMVKEFYMKTKHKMKKMWNYSSRPLQVLPHQFNFQRKIFPQRFYFQTKKGLILFLEDTPVFSQERGVYTLKSLHQIFHKNINWTNYKSSIYNCVYYIHESTKTNVFSILKISSNRYLFAYQPKYIDKTEVEQIVFEFFIENNI
jgi:hypothetical protein